MVDLDTNARAIFYEALDRASPDELSAYLEEACGQDPELRRRVDDLLQAHREAGNFLGGVPSSGGTVEHSPITERPGTVIGPYKLLQQIGEGGFGIVFLAEQERPVRRRVALKVIKPGMDTREVIARFEAERQALALMDHPNIAKVHDTGATENGRPYFVMDLVKGVPITKYCDEHHLTPRQRLELFIPVCQAVQHAHQKGIIHRDLKPSNVMVALYDGKPVPKIIDFGVAKATGPKLTDRTMFTALGAVIGTFEYMSPEQAELNQLDVDTRSDVYSLGVLLYELLTGTTPLDRQRLKKSALQEVLRLIREEEPLVPSTRINSSVNLPSVAANRGTEPARLSGLVRGELDWIVMKCLEKDRNRRYESASNLARDIERHLHDEPVQACPPSIPYRLKKFVRKHKSAAAFIGLLLASVAGLAVSNFALIRERDAKTAALANATTETAKAKAVSDLLQEMLASSNPDEVKGIDYTVRELLDDFSDGVGTELSGQPEIEAEIRATVGKAYWRLGVTANAELHLKRALELHRSLFGPDHEKVADSLVDYAWNLAEQSRHLEAETAIRDALRIYRACGTAAPQVIQAKSGLQRFLISLGRFDEARGIAEEALTLARGSGGDYPVVANILHDMADAANKQGHYAEAEQRARQAVSIHRRLHNAEHPETAWGLRTLGAALLHQRKYPEAEVVLREALAIFRKSYRNDHKTIRFTEEDLLQLLEAQGDEAGIRNLMRQELDETMIRTNHEMFEAWTARGRLHLKLEQRDEAIHAYQEASRLKPNDAEAHFEIGFALHQKGRFHEAIEEYKECIRLDPDRSETHMRLGSCLRQTSQLDDAVASYRKAIELQPSLEFPYMGLAYTLCEQGKFDEAEASARKAIELSPSNAVAYFSLGKAMYGLGKLDVADAAWRKAIELQPRDTKLCNVFNEMAWHFATAPDPKHRDASRSVELATKAIELAPQDGNCWNTLGVARYAAGRWQEAINALQKAMDLSEGGDAFNWYILAMAHGQLGHKEEARAWYGRAIEWTEKNQPNNEELRRFRAEAAELLGITEPEPSAKPTTSNEPQKTERRTQEPAPTDN